MSINELRAAMGPAGTYDWNEYAWVDDGWLSEVTPEQQEIRDYLSLIANNKLQSNTLGSDEALAYLQEQFDSILSINGDFCKADFGAFPCEGLDFTGRDMPYADLSQCTGITAAQIMSASDISNTKLPALTFTGDESFNGKSLFFTDLSKCTGITVAQIMSASEIGGTILPALTFTGNESFDGRSLMGTDFSNCTGITGEQIMSASLIMGTTLPALTFTGNESFDEKNLSSVDLSKCTGITAAQIGSAGNVSNMRITTAQYNEWKSTLQSKFSGKNVYVDGVRTKIQ